MDLTHQHRGDIAEILCLVTEDLKTLVMPELVSETTKSQLAMIVDLLGMIESEIGSDDAASARETAIRTALESAGVPPAETGPLVQLEQLALPPHAATTLPANARTAIVEVAKAEEIRLTGRNRTGHDSYQESGAGAKSDTQEGLPPFDAALLQSYIRMIDPRYQGAEVVSLRRLPGGFSKSTYIADISLNGSTEGWVLRRDMPFSPLRSAVPEEYPLLSTLFAQGFPVAEPLWCEADSTRLGAPTLAVRKIAGEGDMAAWSSDPERAAAIGCNAARIIASIHAVDTATLPPLETNAPGARGATPQQQLDHLRAFWHDKRVDPNPLIELIFGWLEDHVPEGMGRTLVHGDFGLHNLLVEDISIKALLDWEFAHIGDPQEDLAYGRPFISRIMPWQDFVEAYVAAGGKRPDPASLDYYDVFGTFRNAIGCHNVLHAVRHRLRNIDSKFAYVGRAYANALLLDAAKLAGIA